MKPLDRQIWLVTQLAQFTAAIESTTGTAVIPDVANEAFHTLSGFFALLGQIDSRLTDEGTVHAYQ